MIISERQFRPFIHGNFFCNRVVYLDILGTKNNNTHNVYWFFVKKNFVFPFYSLHQTIFGLFKIQNTEFVFSLFSSSRLFDDNEEKNIFRKEEKLRKIH